MNLKMALSFTVSMMFLLIWMHLYLYANWSALSGEPTLGPAGAVDSG